MERLFNLAAGLTEADDTLPARFSREPILVAGEERLISTEAIAKMRRDYYRARGWDERGNPTLALLESLGIEKRKWP